MVRNDRPRVLGLEFLVQPGEKEVRSSLGSTVRSVLSLPLDEDVEGRGSDGGGDVEDLLSLSGSKKGEEGVGNVDGSPEVGVEVRFEVGVVSEKEEERGEKGKGREQRLVPSKRGTRRGLSLHLRSNDSPSGVDSGVQEKDVNS